MVRTRSTTSHRVTLGKTPKVAACKAASSGSTTANNRSSTPGKSRYSGGNPIHPREIPVWQKEITCFFPMKEDQRSQDEVDGESPTDEAAAESLAETADEPMQDEAGPSGT